MAIWNIYKYRDTSKHHWIDTRDTKDNNFLPYENQIKQEEIKWRNSLEYVRWKLAYT